MFSDDIDWCKVQFAGLDRMKFVDNSNKNDAIGDFASMMHCKNNIIAYSTYSWWAAMLNPNMWRRFPRYTEPRYSRRALFFGRMNPYKGVDNLLEIAKKG